MSVYKAQSEFSDPGRHAALLDDLPKGIAQTTAVARNLIVHFVAAGIDFAQERLAEVDSRTVERILDVDQARHPVPLTQPRELSQRVVGCCRDYTLLTVAILRHQGIPARSRVGFATYFDKDFRCDHVIAEYWEDGRWKLADPMLEPGPQWSFDVHDMPRPLFETAAQVWLRHRAGETDAGNYGVVGMPHLRGPAFVRKYVFQELAHLMGDETLLWDEWDEMTRHDDETVDEIARELLTGDAARFHVRPGKVRSYSPTGVVREVDLAGVTQHEHALVVGQQVA